MKIKLIAGAAALTLFIGAASFTHLPSHKEPGAYKISDKSATSNTRALFINLKKIAGNKVLFGHQDDLAYGVGWKSQEGRSDIKDVCGTYPAVYGWDLGKIGSPFNLDSVSFKDMERWIKEVYKRGGVNTIGWHADNFATGGNAWDKSNCVSTILPGGKNHETFKVKLDTIAAFLGRLKDGNTLIPIIFRPYHELTGSWFWWGKENCTKEEYIALWRFTVDYFRKKNLHNILYAYSTDVFNSKEEYLDRYPGDDYVDILGFDDYQSVKPQGESKVLVKRLRDIVTIADEKGKIAVLSETGLESVPDKNWWTNTLLSSIKSDSLAKRIVYVLVWRNANTKHHYGPYPGHLSAQDFIKFEKDDFTSFEKDLPNLYKLP